MRVVKSESGNKVMLETGDKKRLLPLRGCVLTGFRQIGSMVG